MGSGFLRLRMTFPHKRFIQNPDYYLTASDELLEAGALAPGVAGAGDVAGAPEVGLCCPVIFEKFAFSCSGSAWFGLPQAVNINAAKAVARSVSLI